MIGWVTSAAIVALVTATLIFPWQKSVEYTMSLRKEKRELYRAFLAQAVRAVRKIRAEETHLEAEIVELESLSEEIALISDRNTQFNCHRLVTAIALSSQALETQGDPSFDPEMKLCIGNAGNIRILLNRCLKYMKVDLDETKPWPLGKKSAPVVYDLDIL